MFSNYLKVAIRHLIRHKVYSSINIFGLAIGLACCMVIALVVHFHLSFDTFHRSIDRICRINLDIRFKNNPPNGHGGSFAPMGRDFAAMYPEVANYTRVYEKYEKTLVQYDTTQINIWNICYAEPSFFDLFSFELIEGDPKTALSGRNGLILTQQTARKLFGDAKSLGKTVVVNGDADYRVTGILKDIPPNSHIQFDLLVPLERRWSQDELSSYKAFPDYFTYLLLAPGADYRELERKAGGYMREKFPEIADKVYLILQPLSKIHLYSGYLNYDLNYRKLDISVVYVFSAVALLILLIACINFVNLSTARSVKRAKEVGVRKVVGAHRSQLIVQFLCESVLVCLCAVVLTVVMIALAWPLLNLYFNNDLNNAHINGWFIFSFMVSLIIIVGILAGLYPAFFLSRPQPRDVLKTAGRRPIKGLGLRRILVVLQFAISIILIISSILIEKQLRWIITQDLGYMKDNIIVIKISDTIRTNIETVRQDLLCNPSILDVCSIGYDPLGKGLRGTTFHMGKESQDQYMTSALSVGYDFVRFFRVKLMEGRVFSAEDGGNVCLINETLKKTLGEESAVGKTIWINEDTGPGQLMEDRKPFRVVGVLRDFYFHTLRQKIQPIVLFIEPSQYRNMAIRIKPEDYTATIGFLRDKWIQYDPSHPFDFSFMDRDIANQYSSEKGNEELIVIFSAISIFLASLGLFGLISFAAEQRTKEIGIRKAIGASAIDIALLLSREFIFLLGLANLIAWPVAGYIMNRWLGSFAYHISLGWSPFVLGGLIAFTIASLTVGYQAFKSATSDPVRALRYE